MPRQQATTASLRLFMHGLTSPTEDPCGPLFEEQLRESVARLERADASIDAGRGIDVEDAFRSIAEKHGFDLRR